MVQPGGARSCSERSDDDHAPRPAFDPQGPTVNGNESTSEDASGVGQGKPALSADPLGWPPPSPLEPGAGQDRVPGDWAVQLALSEFVEPVDSLANTLNLSHATMDAAGSEELDAEAVLLRLEEISGDAHAPLYRQSDEQAVSSLEEQAATALSSLLVPHVAFAGALTPAHRATGDEVRTGLLAIVDAEGPVQGDRLLQVYLEASGGGHLDKVTRRQLNSAVSNLVKSRLVVEWDPRQSGGVRFSTYHSPDQEEIVQRTLGARTLYQVPDEELTELLVLAWNTLGECTPEQRHRLVLRLLGLRRYSSPVSAHFLMLEDRYIE